MFCYCWCYVESQISVFVFHNVLTTLVVKPEQAPYLASAIYHFNMQTWTYCSKCLQSLKAVSDDPDTLFELSKAWNEIDTILIEVPVINLLQSLFDHKMKVLSNSFGTHYKDSN